MKKTLTKLVFTIWVMSFFCQGIYAQPALDVETSPTSEISNAENNVRSNLYLQEQLHTALRAIEQARQDADLAAKKNAELFTERLNSVEKNLALQREHDLENILSLRQSNHSVLMAVAFLGGIGFLALLGTGYFQIRAMNRVAEIGLLFSSGNPFDSDRSLSEGHQSIPARLNSAEHSNSRLLETIEQLEKRIRDLDLASGPSPLVSLSAKTTAESSGFSLHQAFPKTSAETDALLSKGQTALDSGDAEIALTSFEQALAIDPANPEALLKKGAALEALRRMPEAIAAYDQAIGSDQSLTVAYLYKGGALNRLQRFDEAMECYERALKTHPKAVV